MNHIRPVLLSACVLLLASGCHAPQLPSPQHEAAIAQQHAQADSLREQMASIPPPSKNRFMAIHSYESWENPFITVQPNMFELHILQADANPTQIGAGGMFRPTQARRDTVIIAPEKLADAVASIPHSAWPYGRVVAIEEAHKTPKDQQPAVRRAMEAAISQLNDLGVEVYDPTEGTLR